jgi:hypothetical protein
LDSIRTPIGIFAGHVRALVDRVPADHRDVSIPDHSAAHDAPIRVALDHAIALEFGDQALELGSLRLGADEFL